MEISLFEVKLLSVLFIFIISWHVPTFTELQDCNDSLLLEFLCAMILCFCVSILHSSHMNEITVTIKQNTDGKESTENKTKQNYIVLLTHINNRVHDFTLREKNQCGFRFTCKWYTYIVCPCGLR